MRCLATEILLLQQLVAVTVDALTAANVDVKSFFVSAQQRRLKETRKYILMICNFIFLTIITLTMLCSSNQSCIPNSSLLQFL